MAIHRKANKSIDARLVVAKFVENPKWQPIPKETKDLIKRLLLERPSLAGISRVVQVSQSWLQDHVNWLYAKVPRQIPDTGKKVLLTLECDELWSFVGCKDNKQWIWLALDRDTREIVGVHIGGQKRSWGKSFVEQPATRLPEMCHELHRLLVCLREGISS